LAGSVVLGIECVSVFFFQAEDGIRDRNVTGVQTCALPISGAPQRSCPGGKNRRTGSGFFLRAAALPGYGPRRGRTPDQNPGDLRSEERRVGKECKSRCAPDDKKKRKHRAYAGIAVSSAQ